jgi:hypothetical protein
MLPFRPLYPPSSTTHPYDLNRARPLLLYPLLPPDLTLSQPLVESMPPTPELHPLLPILTGSRNFQRIRVAWVIQGKEVKDTISEGKENDVIPTKRDIG